jgi:hypothetical protein
VVPAPNFLAILRAAQNRLAVGLLEIQDFPLFLGLRGLVPTQCPLSASLSHHGVACTCSLTKCQSAWSMHTINSFKSPSSEDSYSPQSPVQQCHIKVRVWPSLYLQPCVSIRAELLKKALSVPLWQSWQINRGIWGL